MTKNHLMMEIARVVSRSSTCQRLQVGCVLTDEYYEQLAIGYNGGYRGGPNCCLFPDAVGSCGCCHAEMNACIKCRFTPHRAFVTTAPCFLCAVALINAHVREVYYMDDYRLTDGVDVLKRAGLQLIRILL